MTFSNRSGAPGSPGPRIVFIICSLPFKVSYAPKTVAQPATCRSYAWRQGTEVGGPGCPVGWLLAERKTSGHWGKASSFLRQSLR